MPSATARPVAFAATALIAVAALAEVAAAQSSPFRRIYDASYFDGLPTTRIDFETDGDGSPIALRAGTTQSMPALAYQAMGIDIQPTIAWVNDGSPDFDAAQGLGGSPQISIPSAIKDIFTINFNPPVRAFGAWVVNNTTAGVRPRFEAFGQIGQYLGTVEFDREFRDGTCGIGEFGFMGLATEFDIASIRVTKDSCTFDDLRFSTTASAAPHLALNGVCAGPFAMRLVGAAADSSVAFLTGPGLGATPIAVGACPTQVSALAAPVTLLGLRPSDADGEAALFIHVPPSMCGVGFVQAVEFGNCTPSNAVAIAPAPSLGCSATDSPARATPVGPEVGGVALR